MIRESGTVYVIAEAGVNHNGDRDMAFQLVEAAAVAGADAVKFQSFSADALATATAAKARYQEKNDQAGESQHNMLKRLELSRAMHHELIQACEKKGIAFLSTPFDIGSLRFLVDELGLRKLKFSSGDLTNGPLLLEGARNAERLILSTGMGTLGEVEAALSVLAFGFVSGSDERPCREAFAAAYASREGQAALKERVWLMHCTTEYPAPLQDVNLRAMHTLAQAFSLETGYSDHTEGIAISVAAAALGACVIEKHFTLDRALPGPDHKASLEPDELAAMVRSIREIELALGNGIKAPRPSELGNAVIAKKSLVAAADIAVGECFTESNLTCKRPGNGRNPMEYWGVLGSISKNPYRKDDLIK